MTVNRSMTKSCIVFLAVPDGLPQGILVNRLKDKLGTRKLPTAELTLDGGLLAGSAASPKRT